MQQSLSLAHNVLIWARQWLAAQAARWACFGVKRWVRDLLTVRGIVTVDATGHVQSIVLNATDRLAHLLVPALVPLLAPTQVVVRVGNT